MGVKNVSDAEPIAAGDAGAAQWWQGAIIYQVYPRSFCDSNGDGIGDLPGLISRLDYVASLGVDAIWVSPFFKSPMKDFGYDVSDYRAVDPMFGDLADFDRLISEAHQRGLRVMIDQVLSHTSDEHPWFIESRSSRDNPRADWYVWADPCEDGTPPNNWLSIFGGSAWQWDARREQYYLHNFLSSQPDLNYHEPAVAEQILAELEFWLKRGVDGVRLDAINYCVHDKHLRSNPPKPASARLGRGFRTDNPYAWQYHLYDKSRPEALEFMERIRALFDRYPGTMTLAELSGEDPVQVMLDYTGDKRLHTAYDFELLSAQFSVDHIRHTVERLQGRGVWPCMSMGNHDVPRVITRWGSDCPQDKRARLLNALLFSLRGTVCSYQGEELGLTEAEIATEDLQDPYGLAFWPMFLGRDGCRTPMPWDDASEGAGFSDARPWLPIPTEHREQAVARQEGKGDSVLAGYRQFVRFRREQPALRLGDIRFMDVPEQGIAFVREHHGEQLLAVFNFGTEALTCGLARPGATQLLDGHGFEGARIDGGGLIVGPCSAGFVRLP